MGVDRAVVNEAFSKFLSDEKLNVNQIRFVNLSTAKELMNVVAEIKSNSEMMA